jgi:quercetin dioxygenase-like cupin family protein
LRILRFEPSQAETIGPRPYDVKLTSSIALAKDGGEAQAYVLYFEPGGEIGPHEAGFGQLFVALSGDGWVAGADGTRMSLSEGEAAHVSRGEIHSKGSETGLTALMVQVGNLVALAP